MRITKRTYFTLEDAQINIELILERAPRELLNAMQKKYSYHWVIFSDRFDEWEEFGEDWTPTELHDKKMRWKDRFEYIYENTAERYLTVLKIYEDSKNDMLNQLGSRTTTRFSDTPQNGGDYSADPYTTNITQGETQVDNLELIDRIDKIAAKYRDVIDEWVKEFEPLFGGEIV